MTFKIINGCAPEYLSAPLEIYAPTRFLRSATQGSNRSNEWVSSMSRPGAIIGDVNGYGLNW